MTDPNRPLPEWAREASLGIFIHWGLYSVPAWAEPTGAWGAVPEGEWFAHNAYAEWYANTIRIEGSPAAIRHAELYGDASYEDFLDTWDTSEFDPTDWAELFHSIGADYVLPVTKHHDGVALWDAPHAGELSTVTRGPRRDLIGPIADAVRDRGIRFAVYYSGGLDWGRTTFPPIESMADLDEYRPTDEAYAQVATAQLRDLIDRYKPSLIWNDIEWPDAGKTDGTLHQLIDHYRAQVPDGVINDRWGIPGLWDYRMSEYDHDSQNEVGFGWEHTRGLGFSFGFNQVEDEALTTTPRELARVYADVVSRGGRLLLNIGPEASGRIADVQRRALNGFAPWITQVKPFTTQRGPVSRDVLDLPEGDNWWRAWTSAGRTIVITDTPDLPVSATDGSELVVIPLPDAS